MTGQSVKEVYQQFWIKSPMIIYGKQIVLYVLDNHQELIEEVFLSKEIDKNFSKICKT